MTTALVPTSVVRNLPCAVTAGILSASKDFFMSLVKNTASVFMFNFLKFFFRAKCYREIIKSE